MTRPFENDGSDRVQVGQKAPGFALEGALDNEFVDVKLSDYAGTWVVLFF